MRTASWLILTGMLLTVSTALEAGGGKKAKKDDEHILGTWALISGERDGEKAGDQFVNEFRLTFLKDGKIQVKMEGRDVDGTFTMNSEKKPKEINFNVD